jgi:hypothetical protein
MNDNGQQISDGLDVSQAAAGQVVTAFVLTNAVAAPILAAATSRIVRKGERRGVPWLGNVRVIAPLHSCLRRPEPTKGAAASLRDLRPLIEPARMSRSLQLSRAPRSLGSSGKSVCAPSTGHLCQGTNVGR